MKKLTILLIVLFMCIVLITPKISTHTNEVKIETKYINTKTKTENINYKKFIKFFNSKKVYTIAITSDYSNTSIAFRKLINTMSINNNKKIYILNISKLSKKDKAKYYNLNKKFKELDTDYIIKSYNKKIIQETTFDKEHIIDLINSYKEGE